MRILLAFPLMIAAFFFPSNGKAEFIISSAIVEFSKGSKQQDIELVSRSKDITYIVTETSLLEHPGEPDEMRKRLDDPVESGLLVTPDKTALAGGARKILRFILLKETHDKDRIYRVDVKPVVKGVSSEDKIGLKILVGYGVLVIMRPAQVKPDYTIKREGKSLKIYNNGNSNIFLQAALQCADEGRKDCKTPPSARVYAGTNVTLPLPLDASVSYTVWDGAESLEKRF